MKSSEFKKILKPLIKQTIKEVMFEEGILSGIVTEVINGLGAKQVVSEARVRSDNTRENSTIREQQEYERGRQERIRRLNESSKLGTVFEGTKEISEGPSYAPLSNVSPSDSGIDITAIEKLASGKWKQLI